MSASAELEAAEKAEKQRLGYETALEFRESCKKMLKTAKLFEDAGRAFTQQGSVFAEELLKHVDKIGRQSTLAPSLVYFGNTIVATMSVQEQMLNEINSNFQTPLSNFVDYDFAELAELKKKSDKAKSEYDAALVRIQTNIRKKHGMETLNQYERELEDSKNVVTAANTELGLKLEELNSKQETKFLRYLAMFMTAQNQYFARGSKLYQNLKPRMDAIQQHISEIDIRDGVKEGHLIKKGKNGSDKKRYYFVLKGGWLYCYKGKMELDDKNALNILLCSVKIPSSYASADNDKRFEMMNPAKKHSIVLQAETEKERDEWVAAIQEAISSTLNSQSTQKGGSAGRRASMLPSATNSLRPLRILQQVAGNTVCADCDTPDPDWASINLGILVCKECSGVHRSLGTHISKVRSLTLDKWAPESLLFMRTVGNQRFNEVFEQKIPEGAPPKPVQKSDRAARERWIKTKYQQKEFLNKTNLSQDELNQALMDILSVPDRDIFKVLLLVAQGANTNFSFPDQDNRTPLHQCVNISDDGVMVEYLLQNGADMFKKERRGWTAAHYSAYLNRFRSARVLLTRGFETTKDRALDSRGRIPLDLAILNGAKETEDLFRGANVDLGDLTLEDVENGRIPELTLSSTFMDYLPAPPEAPEEVVYEDEDDDEDPFDGMGERAYNHAQYSPRPTLSPPIASPTLNSSSTSVPSPSIIPRGIPSPVHTPSPTIPRSTTYDSGIGAVVMPPPSSTTSHRTHHRATSHDANSADKKKKGSFFGLIKSKD
eukprot:Phypoly_transcript_02912.p1 GENE.Phypoly_transcript_02912~~Phypoly_transcript_02912.p1  ORF type:complete len:772 (-),score=150.69 Phypoly_transcript_02912:83-2398(-)